MTISIVIRAYNEAKHIGKLLAGIAAQGLAPDEVILVDSGSTDGTPEIAARRGAKVVHIAKHDFTFGRALNVGCAAATGDILVFVSAHVYPVYDDWLARLVAPFGEQRVALSYGRQRGNEVNKFSEHRVFEKWFPTMSAIPQASYFCNNANCAIRRSAWLEQPYDEMLTGLEDLAWAKERRDRGGWLAYAADSEIVHVHEESWSQVQNRYRREALAMRRIDQHAHFNLTDFLRLFVGNSIADLRVALSEGVFRKELASVLKFRFNQFWGTYKGYHGSPEITAALRQRFYFPLLSGERGLDEGNADRRRIDYDGLSKEATPVEPKSAKIVRLK